MMQPLPGRQQAYYEAASDILYIDPTRVPPHGVAAVVNEVMHSLLGNDHLAPHVYVPRPALTVIEGGAGDESA